MFIPTASQIQQGIASPAGVLVGETAVWNGSTWVRSSVEPMRTPHKARGSFSAYRSGSVQATNAASDTEVLFNAEDWDIDGWFNTGTGRFTPQIAGIYRLSFSIYYITSINDQSRLFAGITKGGTAFRRIDHHLASGTSDTNGVHGTVLVSANGATDDYGVYVYTTETEDIYTGADYSMFQGELIGTL